jgi:hypothetical protein
LDDGELPRGYCGISTISPQSSGFYNWDDSATKARENEDMSQESQAQRHHQEFVRKQHERQISQSAIDANASAAELIAEKITAKLAEQNDIIYRIGQRQGRTTAIAYF